MFKEKIGGTNEMEGPSLREESENLREVMEGLKEGARETLREGRKRPSKQSLIHFYKRNCLL